MSWADIIEARRPPEPVKDTRYTPPPPDEVSELEWDEANFEAERELREQRVLEAEAMRVRRSW